jgi:hypothetical protein
MELIEGPLGAVPPQRQLEEPVSAMGRWRPNWAESGPYA